MKINNKLFKTCALLMVLSATSFCITSCGGTNNDSGKTTLELWAGGQWTGHDAENLQAFIDEYNKDPNQETSIHLTLKTEFEQQFASSLLVGKQPDLVIWDRFNTPTYASQDFLYPIDEYIKNDNIDTSIFQKQAYDELNYSNMQYGLPLDLDIWGIYVNNDMLNAYNKENPTNQAVLPTTWDELYDTAVKLTQRKDGNISVAGYSSQDLHEHFFKYLISTGTDLMGDDGYPNYDTQEVKDTLNFFKKMWNANVSSFSTASKEAFKNKKCAMLNQPVYYSSYLKTYAPDLNYTFIPQPKYKEDAGVQGGMIGGFGIALPKAKSKYQNEEYHSRQKLAWNFMKYWLCSTDVQLQWSKTSNTLPSIKGLYSDPWIQQTQVLKAASSFADNYKVRPSLPGYYYIQVNVYNTYIKEYIEGNSLTMDKLIAKLTEESNKIVDLYKE